jgi:hypothetical protein
MCTVVIASLVLGAGQVLSAQSVTSTQASDSAQLPAEVLFARKYVRALLDSGAVGVIPLTVPNLRTISAYADNMNTLRDMLSPRSVTITLDRWNAVPAKGSVPDLFLVAFRVDGLSKPTELRLFIEEIDDRYLLNTIMTKRTPPSAP